jgi:LysM repeat protein
MTDRGLPIVDGAPACPFVAFEDDRDGRGQAPDHRHRCYAEPRPAPRALAHQEAYCLSSAFPVCPTFQDWARREAATARQAAADAEAAMPEEPPVSQSMPPRDRDGRHAPSTDTPPPLPPRRNPPRDWAAPPPWTGDTGEGLEPEPPSFLAAPPSPVPPPGERSADRDAAAAAWGVESRGLAGSAADRLAGPYVDEEDEPGPVAGGAAYGYGAAGVADVEEDPHARYRPPGAAVGAAAAASAASAPAASSGTRQPTSDRYIPPPSGQDRSSRQPSASSSSGGRKPAAAPKPQRQDASELFGPAWETPRRYEAYPSLRTRVGLPSFGGFPRVGLAAVAVLLAALALFFVGPMLLGIGGSNPGGGGGAPASQPAEELTPTPAPTPKPDPTPQVYTVQKGDTMSKIARRFKVTIEQIMAANPKIKNPDRIAIGDEITIPVPEDDAGDG